MFPFGSAATPEPDIQNPPNLPFGVVTYTPLRANVAVSYAKSQPWYGSKSQCDPNATYIVLFFRRSPDRFCWCKEIVGESKTSCPFLLPSPDPLTVAAIKSGPGDFSLPVRRSSACERGK